MGATAGGQDRAGVEIFFQLLGFERGGHDDESQIGPPRFLELEGAREGDVAVEMALVEFVEKNRGDAAQFWVLQ